MSEARNPAGSFLRPSKINNSELGDKRQRQGGGIKRQKLVEDNRIEEETWKKSLR